MSGTGSWLQFANRMNKFKGSYFQDFADISGDVIVRNTGNVYLQAGSNMFITAGDISMNGYVYCKGVVDLSGNSLSGGGDGGGGGLTSLSIVGIKSMNTTDFMTTGGYATVGSYLNVSGSTTLNGLLIANGNSVFNGQLDGSGASFNSMSVGNVELKGSIIPDINSVYDIGSADKKIRDLYVSEGSIWVGDNNKLAVENEKIIMKRRKRGDTDIPKLIKDKIPFTSLTDKIAHVKTFASNNSLGKTSTDALSTYTVVDWIRFANKKTQLGEDGFTNTNHTASDIYDLTTDFDNDDSGQWSTVSTGIINYAGKAVIGSSANTAALETLGKSTLLGNVAIGGFSNLNYALFVNGGSRFNSNVEVNGISTLSTTNIGASLTVSQNANITGKMGVGKAADGTHHLDVLGSARIQNDAYFKKSLLVGTGVNTTSLATNNATGASMYIETPLTSGVYPDISHNVVINVPNTVFQANDNTIITNKNYLEIDASKRCILPYVRDANGNLVNTGMTNGWELGGPGAYRFDKIHARDINISTETINIEDGSGNKIGMSFDATTGSVNYTVVTKDTADASGETFVIKGVQTQKISSGGGTIDPALLEFTGLSFGDTFDSTFTYNLSSTYNYNLTTTTYTGDGISTFSSSAGAQGLSSFISANNITTLLGDIPTKKSSIIRVGVDNRSDGGLYGIDTVGNKTDLTNKVISVSDNDGGTTLKWTIWGSEAELNATTAGNYLNFIELKNINMVSGTYFVAKTAGTIVYNNSNEDYLTNADLTNVVNGDLFLYINRSPGNNWTKIPVSLPASGSITTQMLTDNIIQPGKIAANAITESKILNGAVTTNKIADGSITAVKFKAGEINGTIFADDAIDGTKIAGNIATSKLVGAISGSLISDNTIVSSKIIDGAITSAKIAYLGVSGDNLMVNSITTSKIVDNAITTSKIQDGVITSSKLATGIINVSSLLADNVVTTNNILGGAVTDGKLASNSVSSIKIQDGSITTAKLAPNSVTIDKISGTVFSGKQDTLLTGAGINITVNNQGKPVISSTVTNDIPDFSITANKLAGSVTATLQSKLTAGAGINISNSNVISSFSSIPNNSVTTAMIRDGAITADKLAIGITDTNSTNNTGEEGTFTGSYTEPNVDSYSFKNNIGSYNSRISSDGLTIVSCNQFDNGMNSKRIIIKERQDNLQSWTNATDTVLQGGTKSGFDIDSSGNTLVYITNEASSVKSISIYDLANNTTKYKKTLKNDNNIKLSSDGTKMAVYNTSDINPGINIYEVNKIQTQPIIQSIIGNTVYYTSNKFSTSSITTTIPLLYKINKLVINNNTWVAVGDGSANTLVVSNDNGSTWIGKGRVFSNYGTSVDYGQGIWVAVGNDFDKTKLMARSTDNGVTWVKSVTLSQGTKMYNMQANDVLYGLGSWWICGTSYELWKSDDAISWTQPADHWSGVYNVVSLSLAKDVIFSTGIGTNNDYQVRMIYLNGITHTYTGDNIKFFGNNVGLGGIGINTAIQKVIHAFGYFIAIGFGGGIGTYSGTDLAKGGNYAQISYSSTPQTSGSWNTLKIFTGKCYDINFDGNQLIATGDDVDPLKRIQYSTDLFNWKSFGLQPYISQLTNIINLNIAGKYAYSNDNGTTWSVGSASSVFDKFTKTFYSKRENLWLAVGEGFYHTIASSNDGINWTGKGKIFSGKGVSIHYGNDTSGNGVWVAVGKDKDHTKNIAWSTDNGDTWNNPSVIIDTNPTDVLYGLDRWWISGNSNGLNWSNDGKIWTTGNKINNHWANVQVVNSISYSDDLRAILSIGNSSNHSYNPSVMHDASLPTGNITYNQIRGQNNELFGLNIGTTTINAYDVIMNKLIHNNGMYIVVGFGGTIGTPTASQVGGCNITVSSEFGGVWRQIRIFTGIGLDILHDGNRWIATGEDVDPAKRIQYSVNGFDWTPLNYPVPSDLVFTPPTFPLSITDSNQVIYVKPTGKYLKEYDETTFTDFNETGSRYVKVLQTIYDYMNFNELEVYDSSGTNVALGKTVTSNLSLWQAGYEFNLLVDGDASTVAITNPTNGYGYLLVDLGAVYTISEIRLTNTHYMPRTSGIRIQVLDVDQNVMFQTPPISGTIVASYVWSIPDLDTRKFTYKRYEEYDSNENALVTTTPFPILTPEGIPIYARYVKIIQEARINEWVHFREIEVFDNSLNNLALNKTVTVFPVADSADIHKFVDGNKSSSDFASSGGTGGYNWVKIDLGANYIINNIKIWNQIDYESRRVRALGCVVKLLNETETEVYSFPAISTLSDDYTFKLTMNIPWTPWERYLDGIRQTYTEPTLTSLSITKVKPPGRFIKILQETANTVINLLELQAYDKNGVNVALGKTVTAFPGWNTGQNGTFLVDGITSPDSIAQTIAGSGNHWMMVDLGDMYEIAEIKIWNRNDTVENRNLAIGLKIQIIDLLDTVVEETTVVTTAEDMYTFTFEPLYVEYKNVSTNEFVTKPFDKYTPIKPPIRYVKLLHTITDEYINLFELEAFDISGTNLALGKTVTAFPGWNTGQNGSLLVNGITSSENIARTTTGSGYHWMMVDLGAVSSIAEIKLWNRNDTIENRNRAIGWKIQLIDEVGTVVEETPVVTTSEDIYTFSFQSLYVEYITTSVNSNVTNIIVRQNKVLYSSDHGDSWTINANKIFDNVTNKISYGNNRWIAVGEDSNNTLSISDDGINWRGQGKIFSNYGKSVLYKNGLWVAVGSDNDGKKAVQFSSDNGITWNNSNIQIFDYGRDISFWKGRWVVCGSSNRVHFSSDGISWGNTSNPSNTTSTTVDHFITLSGIKSLSKRLDNGEYEIDIWSLHDTWNDRTYIYRHAENSSNGIITSGLSQRFLFNNQISTATKTMGNIPMMSNEYNDFATVKNITIIVGWGGTNGYTLSGIYGGADVCIVKRSLHSLTIDHTYKRIFTGSGLTITHDGTKWIATGEHTDPLKRIQYSTDDGETWSPYVLPTLDVSDNIITLINHPVSNRTMYSVNNTNWNTTSNIDSVLDKTNKIYYGNNKWFAVGDGSDNTIASSTDGIFWTGEGKLFSSKGNSIYYKHGVWIAVGKDIDTKKNIAWSKDDGITWTNPSTIIMNEINDIIFAFDYWWICGSDATKIYKSISGTDWTTSLAVPNYSAFLKSFFATSNRLYIIAQVGSHYQQFQTFFIDVGGGISSHLVFGNKISQYYNLPNWFGNIVNKGYYANGITIFAGYGGTTATPTESQYGGCNLAITHDFTTWTYKRIFEGQAYDITYDGSKWIATGEHSDYTRRIQYSTDDGETWLPMFDTIDASNNVTTIISTPLTGEYLYSNDNGTSWTTSNNNVFSSATNKICSNDSNTAWVAVGDGSMNTVAVSTDGIHWTGKGLIFNIRGNSVFYNNGVWVAVGLDTDINRKLAWSTDNGNTWSYPNFYMFYEGMDVVFALNRWIVCGFGNFIFWSLDGITWNDANKLLIHSTQWLVNKLQVSGERVMVSGRNDNNTAFFRYLFLNPNLVVNTETFRTIPLTIGATQHGFIELNDIVYHNGAYYLAGDVGDDSDITKNDNDLVIYNGPVSNSNHWDTTTSFSSYKDIFNNGIGKSINTDGSKLIITGESSDASKRVQYSDDNGINWNSYLPVSTLPTNYVTNIITLSNTGKYAYSTNEGLNWTVNDDNVFSVSMNKIHYSKSQRIWMAVGEGSTNTVAVSTDGINWTGKGMIFNVKGNSVYYTGGLWVAVGKDTDTTKNIAWSTDNGDTWTYPSTTLLTIHGNDVLYALNRWFVSGNGVSVYWSFNGITWNTTNKHTVPNISANSDVLNMFWDQHKIHLSIFDYTQTGTNFVLWNSSQIQTVLSNSATSQSINATGGNKTVFSSESGGNVHVGKITYGNGIYMAAGSGNGNIAYHKNPNATGWNRQTIFTGAGKDIIYDGSKWIATGEHSTLANRIQYSTDRGVTWYPSGISELDTIGDANTIIKYYSTFSPEEKVPKVSYIYKKRDAINILYQEINYNSCVYNESLSDQIMVYTAIDTATETNATSKSNTIVIPSVVKANTVTVGTGANTMAYCVDYGMEFIGLGNSIFSIAGHKVHHNGDTWVAVGEGINTIAVSNDGINWTGKGMIFGIRGKSVHYAKGVWVAVGEDTISSRCIAYSTNNGATWSYSSNGVFSTSANDIVYTDYNGWIAVGQGTVNTLATSDNGIAWSGQGLVMDISIDSIAYGGAYYIIVGGRDTNLNKCFLYNDPVQITVQHTSVVRNFTPFIWKNINNPHNWTRVYSVFHHDGIYGITSDGSTRKVSTGTSWNNPNATTTYPTFSSYAKGILILGGEMQWTYGRDTGITNSLFKMIAGGTFINNRTTSSIHLELNHVEYNAFHKKILSIPFYDKEYYLLDRFGLASRVNGSWSNSNISRYRMTFSGDGNYVAVSASNNAGTTSVFKINYSNYSHSEDYAIDGILELTSTGYTTNSNHYGKDITLNYDGSIFAYSYGSSTVDSDTTKIPKVVIFSRDPTSGLWNSIPDATLSGSDFYEYSDFIPVLKHISGFGATLKLSADGKTLAVTSYDDNLWCGMRVFKKKSGVWLPFITDIQDTTDTVTKTTANGDVHMTDNGQIIVWNYMSSTHISTIPDSEIYTSVRLAPMSGASAYLHVGQDSTAYDSEYGIHSDWYSAANTNGRIYSYPLSNSINHSKEFALQSRNHLSFYTGLALSDNPTANDNNNGNLRMYIDNTGLVGIGKKSTLHQLDVSGSINATNGIYSSGTILNTSDDRLKDNEMRIENAISTLMNLTPEIYDKKSTFDGTDYVKESGLIAQDIWYNSPELRHLVNLGTKVDGTKTVTENVKLPINCLKDNVSSYLNEDGERIYMVAGRNITKEELDNDLSFKTVISQYQVPNIVPVVPEDIQDISLNNINIQEDPDYTALGWGDTPASVNYNGLIPYLVKAMQEQQDMINQLKSEINTLKNA